jgi:hypothetical protein
MTARTVAALAMALMLTAQAPPKQPSAQQQFEAATEALVAGKWEEARAAFEALERRVSARDKNSQSLAVIRLRKGTALLRLGRNDQAEAALTVGLSALVANDPTIVEDRFDALLHLGTIAERRLDYAGAVARYRAAEQAAYNGASRSIALSGAARTGLFTDAEAALRDVDAALRIAETEAPKDKELRAALRNLKGRVLLNMGRFQEARRELKEATGDLGGLTMKVDASDLAVRSDNAIAALLGGAEEEARRYLAYSGAGRTTTDFNPGAEMIPPACENLEGVGPDDVVVIEISVLDDGSVGHAKPIYASRQGPSALAFARAAANWSWPAEQVKQIPLLFRLLTRVELRCTKSAGRPSVIGVLSEEVHDWLRANSVPMPEDDGTSDARQLKQLQDELARREAASGKQAPTTLPLLIALAENQVVPAQQSTEFLERAFQIARSMNAPAPVLAYLGIRLAACKTMTQEKPWTKVPELGTLLSDPQINADPRAVAAIQLYLADYYYYRDRLGDAKQLLGDIRKSALGPNDPLKTGALVRLASLEISSGNAEAARAAFAESGLEANQCALLDAQPRMKRLSASSKDYPMEAIRWGFEGWARSEYDITPAGSATNIRTTVAYPPFVFGKSAQQIFQNSKFEQTFRPAGDLGCSAASNVVRFKMPD